MAACSSQHDAGDSDSDSSDEEETRRLREAVVSPDCTIIKQASFTGVPSRKTPKGDQRSVPVLPSKRSVDKNDENIENELGTTPECRAFIAKKLSAMLDRELEGSMVQQAKEMNGKGPTKEGSLTSQGIHLFMASSKLLTDVSDPVTPAISSAPRRRRKVSSSSSDSSEDERLASVAVTEEFLAKERATLARLHQNSSSNADEADSTCVSEKSVNSDIVSSAVSAAHDKKKKKKKKQKKSEDISEQNVDMDTRKTTEYSKTMQKELQGKITDIQDSAYDPCARKKKCKKKKKGDRVCEGETRPPSVENNCQVNNGERPQSREWWSPDSWPASSNSKYKNDNV